MGEPRLVLQQTHSILGVCFLSSRFSGSNMIVVVAVVSTSKFVTMEVDIWTD